VINKTFLSATGIVKLKLSQRITAYQTHSHTITIVDKFY
jgi:hypothetical protein